MKREKRLSVLFKTVQTLQMTYTVQYMTRVTDKLRTVSEKQQGQIPDLCRLLIQH